MLRIIIRSPPRCLTQTSKRGSAASSSLSALKFSARLSIATPPATTASHDTVQATSPGDVEPQPKKMKKTIAELDEELRMKLEGISGDGGASGVEYEGGKAEGLKRGVKANMFRVI
ncbi:hypothetical protein CSAL01_04465 [Colletotrichum salicis]|uniref:Uncharacterized protein n=1 Tax=Colletotrichum salicis TaxID=1209931 RepID=A0A135RQ99_9PEZI|nr:hypothetical protein CSAL01_04465 [Colletotrichum salicis]